MTARRFSFFSGLAAALLIIFTSCAAPQTSTLPAVGTSTPTGLKILGITGISEIKPSTSDNLTCVTNNDYAGNLAYTWTADNGTIQGNGKQVIWSAPEAPGDYSVSVKVTGGGQGDTFSRTIKVTTNPYLNDQPDTTIYLKFTLPSKDTVSQSGHMRVWSTQDIQCLVDGSNPEDLTYTWTAPTGKLAGNGLSEGKANRVGWIAPGQAGDYKVSVLVSDKWGNSARGEVDFNIYCCHP